MARIAGVDLPPSKQIWIGLTYIYGIGRKRSKSILAKARVDEVRKVADGLYLGVSRFANAKKPGKRLYPFLLEGPAAEFLGADS